MRRLTTDGTAEPVSCRETKFLGENGEREKKRKKNVSCSAHHKQDWQPYPVDPHSPIKRPHCIHPTVITGALSRTKDNKSAWSTCVLSAGCPLHPDVHLADRTHFFMEHLKRRVHTR